MNFKTSLSIRGTKAELEAIIPSLKMLGYKLSNLHAVFKQGRNSVCTDWNGGHPELMAITSETHSNGDERFIVEASSAQLVLALAAMTDGDSYAVGEWIVCKEGTGLAFHAGGMYEARRRSGSYILVFKDDCGSTTNGLVHEKFRKATKEEIINHFNTNTSNKPIKTCPTETWCDSFARGVMLGKTPQPDYNQQPIILRRPSAKKTLITL